MNILIVDDNKIIQKVLSKYLQKLGLTVRVANDGLEALKCLKKMAFEIVISDWMMPNLNGLDLCKHIRKTTTTNYIYIILLTGLSDKSHMIKGFESGADDFLTKPIDFDELKVRINSAQRVIHFEQALAHKNNELKQAHETILNDLNNAAMVQKSLLPVKINDEKITIDWFYHPATVIGGDSFNYFYLNENILLYYSVDVSGHGISSALVSLSLHHLISSLIKNNDIDEHTDLSILISEKLAKLNQIFLQEHQHGHYWTMIFGLVDFTKNQLYWTQAGHPQPFFYDKQQNKMCVLLVNGFPMGLLEEAIFEVQTLSFSTGDKLILYSDGFNEMRTNNIELNVDNLNEKFSEICQQNLKSIISQVAKKWFNLSDLNHCPDDLSLIIFEFK